MNYIAKVEDISPYIPVKHTCLMFRSIKVTYSLPIQVQTYQWDKFQRIVEQFTYTVNSEICVSGNS